MKRLLTSTLLFIAFTSITSRGLHEEFTWTRINYQWPQQRTKRQVQHRNAYMGTSKGRPNRYAAAPSGGLMFPGNTNIGDRQTNPGSTNNATKLSETSVPYTYQNNIPMGANVWNNKLFITVPRRRLGVPSTLNYVWLNGTQRHNVPLIPYPDWETNVLGGDAPRGHKFVSVYRVAVDPCDRLWFVDTGRMELPGNPTQVQPIALYIIDLRTNEIIQKHTFNSSVLQANTALASIHIDTTNDTCDNAFAYIPDLAGYGLIVYSFKQDRSWRVTHNYFFLEPLAGEFSIGGHHFQWNDGIFSVALTDFKSDGSRDVYFHSMAGTHLYSVSSNLLKNETLATRSFHGEDFQVVGDRGALSQTSSTDLHKPSGILFLGLVNQNALGCWNIASPLKDISIVQKDDRRMIYPCDVKVYKDNVIVLTNTMPVFLYGTLNYDETNFRVWIENVGKAIEGTKCAQGAG